MSDPEHQQEVDPRWSCTRKKGYPTLEIAESIARKAESENPRASLNAYACTHCGQYHIGRRQHA